MQVAGIWLVLLSISLISCARGHLDNHPVEIQDWDILIFTQSWPITVCEEWKQSNEKHECLLPSPEQLWTIHGIWPTKLGTLTPSFCNRTWHFDVEQVRTIEPVLNQLWINVEKETSTYALWAHEWNKHGTCAAVLPQLASEFNYFSQGIRWIKQYSMNTILAAAEIFPHPTKQYSIEDFHKAIKNQMGVEPMIECRTVNGVNIIDELRICFTKKLELVDCTGAKRGNVYLENGSKYETNCPENKGILYPVTVSSVKQSPPQTFLVEFYRFITWLQWFTL